MSVDHDISDFVRRNVRSVWTLELLLLLRRAPERRWGVSELVGELRASEALVVDNLQVLARIGLAIADECARYRYASAGAALDDICDRLAEAYRVRPVAVINLIAKPDPLKSLADAFKLRRRDK